MKSTRAMKPAADQMGKGLDYMGGEGYSRKANRLQHNHWSGHYNDGRLVNKGRGPTMGNECYYGEGGPSATKDPYRAAPTSPLPKFAPGKDMFPESANPQVRTPGGTKEFKKYPNPDRINMSGYSMGDGKVSAGKTPVSKPSNVDGMNYGPKKQY